MQEITMNKFNQIFFLTLIALISMGAVNDDPHRHNFSIVNAAETFKVILGEPTTITADRTVLFQDAEMKVSTSAELTKLGGIETGATADQTITLTGDVTGSGTGSFAATIANNAVGLDEMAGGTDGNLITYDSSGDPAFVATGTLGQVLTSNGAGAAPTMQNVQGAAMHQVLTDGTTITWDQSAGTFATLTLTDAVGTRTLNITNDVVGQSFLILIQDSTDGLELIATWDASIKFTVGIDPTLSEGLSEEDVIVFFSDGTTQYAFTGYDYQ